MQRQSELVVSDERKEAVGAVASPFHPHRFAVRTDFRLDVGPAFAHDPHVKAFSLEQVSIGIPAGGDGFVSVVEQIEVTGNSCAGN